MLSGDRRMEAETYLSSGYGIKLTLESRPGGWTKLEEVAKAWMPYRLKGIQVGPQLGTPFLAATQVFDIRPIARKWLALARTNNASRRFVEPGTILVTCSGTVGRSTLATNLLQNTLISHDLLRVEPIDKAQWGWLYAYLLSKQARAMMAGAHYGQIIKHLEPSHLNALPIPTIDADLISDFEKRAKEVLDLRNQSYGLTADAERLFGKMLGDPPEADSGENGFSLKTTSLMRGRRRFDAANHRPITSSLRAHLAANGKGFTSILGAGYEVWLPTRFKRIPASEGVWLWESAALTEVNPQPTKRIAEVDFGDPFQGRVEAGWVLVARSGQVYGIIGTTVLASAAMEGNVISDDVIRVRPLPDASIRPGYLVTALSHPRLGQPLVKALPYGSSVPHIEVTDLQAFEVVRLAKDAEAEIADLAERAAKARADADLIERYIAQDASLLIEEFAHRPAVRLVSDSIERPTTKHIDKLDPKDEFESLAKQWRIERPRGGDLDDLVNTPAYRAVIAMGDRAVRPILQQLQTAPEHWFYALHKITGANPVSPKEEGNKKAMAAAWLKWGKERGYNGELD